MMKKVQSSKFKVDGECFILIITRFSFSIFLFILFSSGAFSQEIINLQKALQTGLGNNFSILLQKNDFQIAKNNNTLGNAGFLPSVALNVAQNNTISTTHQEQFSGTVKDVDNAKNNTLNIGVQANWTVFDGLNMFIAKKMLGVFEDLGENGTRIVMEGFVSDVSVAYYGIIQLGKLVQVAREALDLSKQRKMIAEAKVSLGSGSQLMLMQSTVDMNADSTRLIQQLMALTNLHAEFNRLLGRDIDIPFVIQDSISFSGIKPFDTILHLSLVQNAQLIAARLNQDIARLGVNQAQSERYPQVSLTAGYNYNTLNSQTGFLQYNRSYGPSHGITLTYNLFNGFNVTRAINNAKVILNSGDLEIQDTELILKSALVRLQNEFQSNLQIVELQHTNVQVAEENVAIAFEKYKLGTINDIELREIQRKLIDAEYQLIASQYEVKKAEIEISRYSGELLKNINPE